MTENREEVRPEFGESPVLPRLFGDAPLGDSYSTCAFCSGSFGRECPNNGVNGTEAVGSSDPVGGPPVHLPETSASVDR
jgi:hypothetical protein